MTNNNFCTVTYINSMMVLFFFHYARLVLREVQPFVNRVDVLFPNMVEDIPYAAGTVFYASSLSITLSLSYPDDFPMDFDSIRRYPLSVFVRFCRLYIGQYF